MNNTNHTYGNLNRFNRFMFLMLSIVLTATGLFYLVYFIDALINNIPLASTYFWYFIVAAVWSPFVFVFMTYIFSDIMIDDTGLYITFLYKNLFMKWEDISEVKVSKPFGLQIGKKANVLIVRNGLTWFHRIYGIVYGQINQPALLIWSNISEYDALIKKVFKNRKKK